MRNIEQALLEHKQVILDAGYVEDQILGVFLYGSQNYGLATENSDVDTKVVIIPTLEDLCKNKKGFVKEYKYNDEKIVVMDIIHLMDNFKKQNINYVEVLFTEYKWVNPKHNFIWDYLVEIREQIAYYNKERAVLSMGHQALHTLKQDSSNPKKFAMATYLAHFLSVYIEGHLYRAPYQAALYQPPHVREYILALKKGEKKYTAMDVINLRKELEKIVYNTPQMLLMSDKTMQKKLDEHMLQICVTAIRNLENL